jgi:hypothetical protein
MINQRLPIVAMLLAGSGHHEFLTDNLHGARHPWMKNVISMQREGTCQDEAGPEGWPAGRSSQSEGW